MAACQSHRVHGVHQVCHHVGLGKESDNSFQFKRVPSSRNLADFESRNFKDSWDFKLDPAMFNWACQKLNFNPKRDMFSSRLSPRFTIRYVATHT